MAYGIEQYAIRHKVSRDYIPSVISNPTSAELYPAWVKTPRIFSKRSFAESSLKKWVEFGERYNPETGADPRNIDDMEIIPITITFP